MLTYALSSIVTGFFISGDTFLQLFAFSGENLLLGRLWTLVTSIFLHGGLGHLLMNCVALFFFGRAVEKEVSVKMFLGIFFVGGLMGNLFGLFYYPYDQIMLGSSGAVFAIMGTGMLLAPFKLVFYPSLVPLPLAFVGLVITVFETISFIAGPDTGIAHIAHIGGLLTGMLFGLREGESKRGLLILGIMFLILLLTPNFWQLLTRFSYSALIDFVLGIF